MHRFFINSEDIAGQQVTFPRDLAHQIIHVLRFDKGDQVAVLDNRGHIHQVRLVVDRHAMTVTGKIVATNPITTEPNCYISLYFGLSSREKVEWILQKGTEVGVSAFFPFHSSRTLVQSATLSAKRITRWERIIREAAEQSARGRLPVLHQVQALTSNLSNISHQYPLCLLAWEDAQSEAEKLHELLQGFAVDSVALFVGPEGGFSKDEVSLAIDAGCRVVSLGARILRMETAAIILPALVLYELGA
jgi:16S rRNA (uracil1498-N3)-methyltransferase